MKGILIAVAFASALLLSPLAEAKSKKSKTYDTTWTYHKKTKVWTIKKKARLSTLEVIEKLQRKRRR